MRFRNRDHAAQLLADRLAAYRGQHPSRWSVSPRQRFFTRLVSSSRISPRFPMRRQIAILMLGLGIVLLARPHWLA